MNLLAYYQHDLGPFVPFLHYGEKFGVRWYGLAYVLGFVGAAWILQRYAKAGRSQLAAEKVWDLILVVVIGVMLGGRLGSFLLYHPQDLLSDPLSFFRIWEGGMASHGGFFGVGVAIWIYARREKIGFLHLSDLIVSTAPFGLMLGRIANFINGELWGKPTAQGWGDSWGVLFPFSPLPMVPRHPSQLYEAALEGVVLLAYLQWRFWKTNLARHAIGAITGEFLIGYALMRCIGELFREPDQDVTLILGIFSRGTFYSFFMIVAGIAIIVGVRLRKKPQSHLA